MSISFMKFKPFSAPQRYIFKDPDTGHFYNEANKQELVKAIVSYRVQNQLEPIEHLGAVLESYWCGLPENVGACQPAKPFSRGFFGYIKGGVALVKNIYYGDSNIVSADLADKRAEVCIGCRYNTFPDKGMFIQWSDEVAEASVGDSKSKYHDLLGNCEVCSCPLRAKVFYKGPSDLTTQERTQMREVGCWQVNPNNLFDNK